LKTQFHKEFVRGIDDRLAKRLVDGPTTPGLAVSGYHNFGP
jgi:hypothetical protein